MNDFYMIVIVLAAFVAGLFVVPFVKNRGWLSKDTASSLLDTVGFTKLLLGILYSKGVDTSKANFILDITDIVADYVVQTIGDDPNLDKRTISLEYVLRILEKYGVKPSKQELELIEIVIDQSIKFADK